VSAAALAELLRESRSTVVLTGAGVSTESGIPDFRSPTGWWARFDPAIYSSIDTFRRDPRRVWEFHGPRLRLLAGAQPNAAHLALAELERRGLVRAVVTQNIDMLHVKAGSCDVVEVHGSMRTSSCPACGARYPGARVLPLVDEHGAPPCPACGEILKPDVVLFGEVLPAAAIDRAYALAQEAELLLVIGSSLQVYPVASLPDETRRAGGRLAIVNVGETPYDHVAALRVEGPAGETLSAVLAAL
jgi:NAD-dependent deacetylase